MQELIGLYITMEEYFMRETVNKVGQSTLPLEMGFLSKKQAEGNGQDMSYFLVLLCEYPCMQTEWHHVVWLVAMLWSCHALYRHSWDFFPKDQKRTPPLLREPCLFPASWRYVGEESRGRSSSPDVLHPR